MATTPKFGLSKIAERRRRQGVPVEIAAKS